MTIQVLLPTRELSISMTSKQLGQMSYHSDRFHGMEKILQGYGNHAVTNGPI